MNTKFCVEGKRGEGGGGGGDCIKATPTTPKTLNIFDRVFSSSTRRDKSMRRSEIDFS